MDQKQLEQIKSYLGTYDGPQIHIMEVCGSHTAAIAKNGIPGLLSPQIHLISGPGCPVCVTPSAYIDKAIEIAMTPGYTLVTFGDLLRVPGSQTSLSAAKGQGAKVEMVYSPMDTIQLAREHPETTYVFAAIGFETTTPVYALLLETIIGEQISNIKLLTAIKTMPQAMDYICANGSDIQGFIAPGHVAVVTGSGCFKPIADKYGLPMAVAPFDGAGLLAAIAGIVEAYGAGRVMNLYPSVVTEEGNTQAQALINKYFTSEDAVWRGMGSIPGSGRFLKPEYAAYDAGSRQLNEDHKWNKACSCDQVLLGKIKPKQCPLYGKVCTPLTPQGACMVSEEGNCHSYFVNRRDD